MTNDLLTLFTVVAQQAQPMAPEQQRRLYRRALTASDNTLLLALIARPDAPEDLRAEYAAMSAAAARIAYLSRPDVPTAQLEAALRQETRVTVLAGLAAAPSATPALLKALADAWAERRRTGQPFAALEDALLAAPATPSHVLLRVLQALNRTGGRQSRWRDQDQPVLLRLDVADVATAIRTLSPWHVSVLLTRAGLSAAVRIEGLTVLEPHMFGMPSGVAATQSTASVFGNLLACPDLQLEVLQVMDELAQRYQGGPRRVSDSLRAELVVACAGLLDPSLTPAARTRRSQDLDAASDAGTDPGRLLALATAAGADDDGPLASRLATNPSLPATAMREVARLLTVPDTVETAWAVQHEVPGRDEARVALLLAHPNLTASRNGIRAEVAPALPASLDHFDRPEAAAATLLHAWSARIVTLPRQARARSLELFAFLRTMDHPAAADVDPYPLLPWEFVYRQLVPARTPVGTESIVAARTMVTRFMASHLTCEEALSVFAALAEDFPGTVRELFETAQAAAR